MNLRGVDRFGTTDGNVMTQLPNGFTKGTSVHTLGPDINTTAELRWHKPYVSRSIKARDPYYDDHKHDAKLRTAVPITSWWVEPIVRPDFVANKIEVTKQSRQKFFLLV